MDDNIIVVRPGDKDKAFVYDIFTCKKCGCIFKVKQGYSSVEYPKGVRHECPTCNEWVYLAVFFGHDTGENLP